MKQGTDTYNELKGISPMIAGLDRSNVLSLPEGYFNRLPELILDKCLLQASSKIKTEVPEGYFDSLADNILNRIKNSAEETASRELRKLSPMLYALQGEEVYKVPRGYFADLPEQIVSRVSRKARVVSLKPAALWKYAVAAVATGIIAVSSLWFSNQDSSSEQEVAINKTEVNQVIIEAAQYTSESQITSELESVSDEAIINYLQSTATPGDLEMLSTSVDQQDLPNAEDYLLDENALDKYLEEINRNNTIN